MENYLKAIEEEKPMFLIDLVGSEKSGTLFEQMPANSEMIVLGNISNASLKLSTTEFFMHNKRIRGFNVISYIRDEMKDERRRDLMKIIEDDINSGGEYFGASIAKEFRLEDWNQAL